MTDLNKMFDQIVNKFVQRYRETIPGKDDKVVLHPPWGSDLHIGIPPLGKRYVERLGYVADANAINDTLEICAQVADEYTAWPAREIAATIRAKKTNA